MKHNRLFRREYFSIALIAVLIVVGFFWVPGFNNLGMYFNILTQASLTGIFSLGMLFVLICGDVDLSIDAQTALYGIVCTYLIKTLELPPLLSILCTLLCATWIGALIGWLIDSRSFPPMIATIALGITLSGLANIITQGLPIFNIPPFLEKMARLQLFGLSFSALLFAALTLVTVLILHRTYWGKFFYAVGCSAAASAQAGVPVRRTRMGAYALCSLFCAAGSIAFVGRTGVATLGGGSSYVLDVMTVAALSGVGFSGGHGKVLPVVCATLFLTTLTAAFLALRVAPYYQNVIKGAILFLTISTKNHKS